MNLNRRPLWRGLLMLAAATLTLQGLVAEPLRVFIRGGMSNRGTEVHAHPRFLKEWQVLLNERGAKATGAMDWPTPDQINDVDVIVSYAQEGGDATPEQEAMINEFVKRGGGLVVIHTASVSFKNPPWWKSVIGGSWVPNKTRWREGPMDLFYVESQRIDGGHPITRGASNFHVDDEIYYDMDISPDARVLATSYTPNVLEGRQPAEGNKPHIYDIQPQMWVYEKTAEGGSKPYRAFVSIPGHLYKSFSLSHYRAILLRGIAWTGQRENIDEFCKPEEISSLTYPEGGPQRPAQTLANLEIHPDFEMTLVAAEPLITKPMNFDWDAAGRLWVAETPEYPNGRRGMRPDYRGKEWKDRGGIDFAPGVQDRPARDKISILHDTDGDGVMDKKDIFFEGLDLVTGLVFYRDGVIVTQAPDILFLRDTDADGTADKVEKLYTNLGTGDTHAVINNPRWGWDGWIYATHGYSGTPDVRSGDGSKGFGGIGSGVVRFKPDGSAFEQYSSKGGNTWGLQITGDNRVMWTQPTSGQLLMHTILPEYALARGSVGRVPSFHVVEPSPKSFPLLTWEQLAYVQIDWVGSFTAAAGTVVYDGGAWPAEYTGDYFTTEPTINVVHHTRLTPQGASYTAKKLPGREETEFIRSKDMWWRPIEVRVGPDGAMYLADFYNQAVIHNDTRGPDHNRVNAAVRPDRDHYFGRIWKINHKQAKKLPVPNLATADRRARAEALSHPNRHVRLVAHRLIAESPPQAEAISRELLPDIQALEPESRIAALWTLAAIPGLDIGWWTQQFLGDSESAVRRNAALVAETTAQSTAATAALLNDAEAAVRLAALRALAAGELDEAAAKALIATWPKFDDDYQRSAAIGAATRNPAASIAAALEATDAAALTPLVNNLVTRLAEANDSAAAAALVIALADKPSSVDDLKLRILDTLAKSLPQEPPMTPDLKGALTKLLASGASATALPLTVKWDAGRGDFAGAIDGIRKKFAEILANAQAGDADRVAAARTLLGIRTSSQDILPTIEAQLVAADNPVGLKQGVIAALGETADPSVGSLLVAAYAKLSPEVQSTAFETLLKRADWAMSLLDGVKAKTIDAAAFGPANAYRLRTHPAREVAERANAMKDQLNPNEKAKNEVIDSLVPVVTQPGNLANGKTMFTVSCATCHKLGDEGVEIGPTLTGMGAHGPEELLVHIVDPNREVDPSFNAWNFETTDGQLYAGVIARQNNASVLLRTLTGEVEIATNKIKSRVDTGRSLMPEGLEAVGGENLRDILAYMAGDAAGKYRVLDLAKSATADGRRGLFLSQDAVAETVKLRQFGNLEIEGVPFFLTDPKKAIGGRNLIVLKGGHEGEFAQTFPSSVDIPVGVAAQRLHLLSGVAGWAWPYGGDEVRGRPAMKMTIHYAGGTSETFTFRNGVEFADYIGEADVRGSKRARRLTNGGQIRVMTVVPARPDVISRLSVESLNNSIAPVIAAVTAELPGAEKKGGGPEIRSTDEAAAAPTPSAAPDAWEPGKKKILLIGGGASHDFKRWFNETDSATLRQAGYSTRYVDTVEHATASITEADAVVYSTNQSSFAGLGFQLALRKATDAGVGMVILHAGLWYNFGDDQTFNRVFLGGGSRGHDSIQEFKVQVTDQNHPVAAGLGDGFSAPDELYYSTFDPAGSPTKVVATATSPQSGKTFPSIWTVAHPKAKIVCIASGHDERVHHLPSFHKLLTNAVGWAVK
ncbi:MAG: PVC-type heme-binding CxxCH protein [Verrucomicrobiales bacterium]